jgi:hypothetical protein
VAGTWLTDSGRRAAVQIAPNLIPFAGIAFPGSSASGIASASARTGFPHVPGRRPVVRGHALYGLVAGGLFAAASRSSGPPGSDTLALGRDVTALLNVYSIRMAAVFTLTTVTIARRTEIVSRWLTVVGIVTALVLLVGVGFTPWVELLFPAWILALSVDILASRRKILPGGTEEAGRC